MRKYVMLLVFALTMLGLGNSYVHGEGSDGNCNHNSGKSHHNYFPTIRVKLEPVFLCDDSAFSLLGEFGEKTYRINGTWGFFSDENQRLKIGGEYLGQKLEYKFSSGRVRRWVTQFALGGKYQYWFECSDFVRGVQVTGAYSHARNHSLSPVSCPSQGVQNFRRIAGGCFWSVGGDFILSPWECGRIITGITFDSVHYNRHYSDSKRLSGIGFNLDYSQRLWRNLMFDFKTQIKRPYNYAEVQLAWRQPFKCGGLAIGIFGNKVWGKGKLPSSRSAGVELRFDFGIENCCIVNCCANDDRDYLCCYDSEELAAWVADPAVYMPEVLAITDSTLCGAIQQTAIVFPVAQQGGFMFDVSSYFTDSNGNELHFTATGLPSGFTISDDGVVKGFNSLASAQLFSVTVTASSVCSTVSQTATLELAGTEV